MSSSTVLGLVLTTATLEELVGRPMIFWGDLGSGSFT